MEFTIYCSERQCNISLVEYESAKQLNNNEFLIFDFIIVMLTRMQWFGWGFVDNQSISINMYSPLLIQTVVWKLKIYNDGEAAVLGYNSI